MGTATELSGSGKVAGAPYPGPRPFSGDDSDIFCGRNREISDLLNLVLTYRIVVLHSQSGAGKTSLINAGLSHHLSSQRIEMLRARVGGQVPPSYSVTEIRNIFSFSVLTSEWARSDHSDLLTARLCEGIPETRGEGTLLVIDQFEELFTAHQERWHEREGFFYQLRDALQRIPELRVLFSMREEYLAELDPYAALLPDGLRIRYRLERLDYNAATRAITEPAQRTGFTVPPQIADHLVRNLQTLKLQTSNGTIEVRGEFVEPVHLQVVCTRFWRKSKLHTGAPIEETDIADIGDVDIALADYYDWAIRNALAAKGPSERRLRRWFSQAMITPAGTRSIVHQGFQMTAGLNNDVVRLLEQQHLVRAEKRAGASWIELTHDRFIEPIRQSNGRYLNVWRRKCFALLTAVLLATIAFSIMPLVSRYRAVSALAGGEEARRFTLLADEALKRGDWETAQAQFKKAAELYRRSNDIFKLAESNIARAQALCFQNQRLAEADGLVAAAERLATEAGLNDLRAASAATAGLLELRRTDQLGAARESLKRAASVNPLTVVQLLDRAITSATTTDGNFRLLLRTERRQLLRDLLKDGVGKTAMPYLCSHNAYVIAASVIPRDADAELARWRPEYPLAELGQPQANFVPVIVDSFLTCDEVKDVIGHVQATKGQGWVVRLAAEGCTAECVDVQRRGDSVHLKKTKIPENAKVKTPAPKRKRL